MKPLSRLLAVCILVPSFLSGQEPSAVPAPPQATSPAAKQESTQPAPAATQTAAPKAQDKPKFYQPEGPDPTEIIAHEHSVTDMLDVVPFTSKIFHNTRMLRVFLPGNYFSPHNRTRRYPVLYLQDGQNVFDKATSFSGKEWEADETVDHLVSEFKIQPMFIVGIDNAGDQRTSEYLSYPDAHNPQFQSATPPELEGTKYAEFLIKEVMPFLQKRYRIALGAGEHRHRRIVLWCRGQLDHSPASSRSIREIAAGEPSLWVGDGKLLTEVEKTKLLPQKIYMGIGTNEAGNPESDALILKDFTYMEQVLKDKGLGTSRLKVVVEGGGQHNEEAWARRFPDALLFLYGR